MYCQTGENLLRDIRKVLFIVLRKQYCAQAHSVGGQQLLLDSADGQDLAAQRDFPGHGHVSQDRNLCQRAYDRRANGDTSGWAILRNGAFWNMQVDVYVAVEVLR